jgi:hypothetical protein
LRSAPAGSTARRAAYDEKCSSSASPPPGAQPLVPDEPRHGDATRRRGPDATAGLAQIERARADGRWDAADAGSRAIEVPADFQAARDAFGAISRTNRYAFLDRINDAKRPQTRAAWIEKFVAMLAAGETLH